MVETIGIIGGGLFLLAFLETASGRWNGKSFWYEFYNLIGAALLAIYAVQKHAYTNIVLNIVWSVVALYALWRIIKRHKHRKKLRNKRNRNT